jgi:hypothetical protein
MLLFVTHDGRKRVFQFRAKWGSKIAW